MFLDLMNYAITTNCYFLKLMWYNGKHKENRYFMQPNQTMPQQPVQPQQPISPTPPQPSVAQQMDAALNEPPVTPPPMSAAPKKKGVGMGLALVLCILLAVAGVAFGAFVLVQKNTEAALYEKQLTDLKKTNSELSNQLAEVNNALSGDEALALLKRTAAKDGVGYEIAYANVYAKYIGDEDKIAYWVKYLPINAADGVATATDIIFTLNDEGEWEYALPGFTETTPEMLNDYALVTVIDAEEDTDEADDAADTADTDSSADVTDATDE